MTHYAERSSIPPVIMILYWSTPRSIPHINKYVNFCQATVSINNIYDTNGSPLFFDCLLALTLEQIPLLRESRKTFRGRRRALALLMISLDRNRLMRRINMPACVSSPFIGTDSALNQDFWQLAVQSSSFNLTSDCKYCMHVLAFDTCR